MSDVADMDDFPQLAWPEESERLTREAVEAVDRLRRYMQPYEAQLASEEAARERLAHERRRVELQRATAQELEKLKDEFFERSWPPCRCSG